MTRAAALILAAALAAGCRAEPEAAPVDTPAAPAAEADAGRLGREVLRLLDQLAEFRGANRNRLPRTLRHLGVDSLTPEFARSFAISGDDAVATVAFRRPDGHALRQCSGGLALLESAAIADGRYVLRCITATGESREMTAGGA
ncbi:MAG TPA: hypothetical protein VFT04_14240 [Gemmatimonadales bacterium]|nr:hypothetical protein [Gemmatimonadales bacterium]